MVQNVFRVPAVTIGIVEEASEVATQEIGRHSCYLNDASSCANLFQCPELA